MPIIYPTSDKVGTGAQIDTTSVPDSISDGDFLVIAEDIDIVSVDAYAISTDDSFGTLSVDVSGTVIGQLGALYLSNAFGGSPADFRVGVGDRGHVVGHDSAAIRFMGSVETPSGGIAQLSNDGVVRGYDGSAVYAIDLDTIAITNNDILDSMDTSFGALYLLVPEVTITNTGHISGNANPIDEDGSSRDVAATIYTSVIIPRGETPQETTLYNSGTISSGGLAYSSNDRPNFIFNSGTIEGAIHIYHYDDFIDNSGVINGELYMGAGTNILENDGTITGSFTGLVGSDNITNDGNFFGEIALGEGMNRVYNSGLIDGNIDGGADDDSVENTGTIAREVRLSDGNNVFVNATTGILSSAYIGGTGVDNVINNGEMGENVELGAGADIFNGRGGIVVGSILGEAGDDTLIGGRFSDTISGGDDNDTIRGLIGDDDIDGGNGNDFIFGGQGDDVIIGAGGNDEVRGGGGDDEINGQSGVDNIYGGDGNDFIRLGNGDGQRGEGNNGDDRIVGGNQKDVILGGANEDELFGNNGDDVLRGGIGDDELDGGGGDDTLRGNAGTDTAIFSGASTDYTFTALANGTYEVDHTGGSMADGTDNLFGIEFLEFTDGTYELSDFFP